MDRDQDLSWSHPRVLTIFAIIFFCGAAFGAVGMRLFLHSRMPLFPYQRTIEKARALPMGVLRKRLELTPEQAKQVAFELDEYGKYYQNIEMERSDVARHGLDDIRKCLTDRQRKVFDEIVGSSQK